MQLLVYSITFGASVVAFVFSIVSLQSPNWIRFQTPSDSPFQYSSTYGLFERCDRSNLFPDYRCRPFPRRSTDCVDQDELRLATVGLGIDPQGFVSPAWLSPQANTTTTTSPLLVAYQHDSRKSDVAKRKDRKGSGTARLRARAMTKAEFEAQADAEFGFCELWHTAGYSAQLSIAIGVTTLLTLLVVMVGNTQRKANAWRLVVGLICIHAAFHILSFAIMFHLFATDSRFYIGSRLGHATFLNVTAWAIDVVAAVALTAAALAGAVDVEEREDERAGYEEIRDD